MSSPLPGFYDGPADAYRHLIGTGELRWRFGFGIAYAIVTGNEIRGTHRSGQPPELRQMDDHNNAIALSIGAQARTFDDVVRLARAAIDMGIARGGDGANGTPTWGGAWGEPEKRPMIQRTLPVQWPDGVPSAVDYTFAAARFGFDGANDATTPRQREAALLERLRDTPTGDWSEADVRTVIGSRPYLNPSMPDHAEWRARVQRYFEERVPHTSAASTSTTVAERDCGGRAPVRAYTRGGPSGPVRVGAYSRAVHCG